MTQFKQYGYRNLEEFIADRDFPMTRASLIAYFEQVTGEKPTSGQLHIMQPDSEEEVQDSLERLYG